MIGSVAALFAAASIAASPCPVTIPNGNSPPAESPSAGHHGAYPLWVALPRTGTINAAREWVEPDGYIGVKFPWWRLIDAPLRIEGHRYDDPNVRVRAHVVPDYAWGGIQPTGIYFPAEGCYAITGSLGSASLSFVVNVELAPPEPRRRDRSGVRAGTLRE